MNPTILAQLLRAKPQITEEEARALMDQVTSDDPMGELYNFGSAIAMAPAGLTSLAAEGIRATGLLDEESVLPEVPARRPELSEIPGTYEWGMERVGAEPYAPESITGSFLDPTALASVVPAAAMAKALRAGEIGQYATTTPGRIKNRTNEFGGYTVNLMTGEVPTEGLMMGMYANDSGKTGVLPKGTPLTKNTIKDWVKTNANALKGVDNHLGTWKDGDTDTLYLDVAKRFAPEEIRKATKYGEKTGQLAGFDIGKLEEFPVGNWRKFIHSDEFTQRLDQMQKVGREYLEQHPAGEWWDIHGSMFEKVYGKDKLEQVAGFIAATAPSTNPTENVRLMTEFMRRHLIGEPIIQRDWRVPEGTQSRNVGSQLSHHETQMPGNLVLANQGDYARLSGDKVNAEARALMGDPDAGVWDRWWARVAEKPEAGVFTGPQEGQIPVPSKAFGHPYQQLTEAVGKAAKNAGRSLRDYSADVWTGIRETVKKENELFGMPFKGSALHGESKSYADLFTDLIESKAKFLNISVDEMIERLGKGDANLLSLVLATPLGTYLYKQFLAEGDDDSGDV